ncbi:MAG: cysteine desulfurase [Firmicutes bacterium]|nr:cysteine desulfurase [Bacillota bacterium]
MIYFDNASTTEVCEDIKENLKDILDMYANPGSLHSFGFECEKQVEKARKQVAEAMGADKDTLYFTSGGTEANNTAILGAAERNKRRGKRVVTCLTEHPSVLESFHELERRGFEVIRLKVDEKGYIDKEELKESINQETVLVSLMAVNNEYGTIQPIEELSRIVKEKNKDCLFHTDCVQAFGKEDINFPQVDLISISAHKIHALKGCGALYVKKGVNINNLHFGGQQERRLRPGTENTFGIFAFGRAAELLKDRQAQREHVLSVKKELLNIKQELEGVYVNGDEEKGSPYILNISFENVKGEVLLHALEEKGIFVSTGAACSSRAKEKKKTVDLLKEGRGAGAVRFSFSRYNTVEEATFCVGVLKEIIPFLREFVPR